MAITASLNMALTISETLTIPDASSANAIVKHDQFNVSKQANGSAPYSVTLTSTMEIPLVSGSATIDFTSLTGTGGGSVTLDTKKPMWILFKNKSTNTGGAITIAKGASNGYTGFGSSFSITLQIGAAVLIDTNQLNASVSSTVKTLDITGSGTDVLQMVVLA